MSNREKSNVLAFNALEQKYIASCYPLPDREGLDACYDWKRRFEAFVANKHESISVKIHDLAEPFPHLARLGLQGYFEEVPVQNYFEGLGEGSHNLNLYLFAVNVARNLKKAPPEVRTTVLRPVLDHISGCAAKPANIKTGELWSYDAVSIAEFDYGLSKLDTDNPYAIVHGLKDKAHQIIRPLSLDEFNKYTAWYEARQKSSHNPFR